MSKRDDEDEETPPAQPQSLQAAWQRKTATAVYNLALGLDAAAKAHKARHDSSEAAARARHDELVGLIMATTASTAKRARHPTPESTDKFKLPAGVELQAPREVTRKFVEKLGKVAFYLALVALTHAARCLAENLAERQGRPAPAGTIAAPAER